MTSTNDIVPSSPCYCGKPDCKIPYGFCHCKCGQKTRISTVNHSGLGWVKGRPLLVVRFHKPKITLPLDYSEPFEVNGELCCKIPLTQGKEAIVDAADYEWLMQWKWYALWNSGKNWYAVRHPNKFVPMIYMHRQILGLSTGEAGQGDHKETGMTLDNRRSNLRPATSQQNSYNTRKPRSNTSGRKGVSWSKLRNKWIVQIRINGKKTYIGAYVLFEEACAVREAAEKKYHGEFARAE